MKKRRDNSDGHARERRSSGEVAGRDGDLDVVEIIEDDSGEQLRCVRVRVRVCVCVCLCGEVFTNLMRFFFCFPSSTDVSFSCNVFFLCVWST